MSPVSSVWTRRSSQGLAEGPKGFLLTLTSLWISSSINLWPAWKPQGGSLDLVFLRHLLSQCLSDTSHQVTREQLKYMEHLPCADTVLSALW